MSREKVERINIHELLLRRSYDHAVICTFSFDPKFFEDYCLTKFNSLHNNGNVTVIIDRETYERAILGPEGNRPKQANLRYLLCPISVPGAFHSKLILLASRTKGRLILGSANFTRPGITSNAELVCCYDFEEEKNEVFKDLFQSSFSLLQKISDRWPNESYRSNLQEMIMEAPWLVPFDRISDGRYCLLDNLERTLWSQIKSHIKSPVDTIYILSRYFDSEPFLLNILFQDLSPKAIKIFTQNGITTMTKKWLSHPLVKQGKVQLYLSTYMDEGHIQPLHAKAITIKSHNKYLHAFGSANFTNNALLQTAASGNVEILMLLKDLSEKDINPNRLYNPNDTAFHLKDEELLKTAASEEEFEGISKEHQIKLIEAIVIANKLRVFVNIPDNIASHKLIAQLNFLNDISKSLEVSEVDSGVLQINLTEDVISLLDKSSTIIKLLSFKNNIETAQSNSLLVTNIQDIHMGNNIRRERHIKTAQKSSYQFYQVLKELIENNDEEALMVFLTFCEIPVLEAPIPSIFGRKPVWDGGRGMRQIGTRNFHIFKSLHEASIIFVEKHIKKLSRHIKFGSINGIPNFMHILLAAGGILRTQLERAVQGLEGRSAPITSDDWYIFRKYTDIYFKKLKELMEYFSDQYLPSLMKEYKMEKIKELLNPEIEPLRELFGDTLKYKSRIDTLIETKLKIGTGFSEIKPSYFSCILSPENWQGYRNTIEKRLSNIERTLQ